MGKNKTKRTSSNKNHHIIKRTIKFIACSPGTDIERHILKRAPDGEIKAIANAALNVREGDIAITSVQQLLFSNKQKIFDQLVDKNKCSIFKRNLILRQKGGAFPLIVPILQSALLGLGSAFITRLFNSNSSNE